MDDLEVDEIEDMIINGKREESIEPHVGMEFASEKHAYNFYNTYGYIIGFSIRKQSRYINTKGIKTNLRMVCSKEGKSRKKRKQMEETIGGLIEKTPEKERSMQRSECKAYCQFRMHKDDEDEPKLKVVKKENDMKFSDPPVSQCKGSRKPTRFKAPADVRDAKKMRTCSYCHKKEGHNMRKCPKMIISIQDDKRKRREPISIQDASEDESEFMSEDDEDYVHGEDQSAFESDAVYGDEEDLF
ncbi:uncharacterized protein LOC144552013 [Carex rostrata]